MNAIDICIALMFLLSAVNGFRKGFRTEVFSFLAVIAGVLLGFKFMGIAMVHLQDRFHISETYLPYASFGAVFLLVIFIVNLAGKIIADTWQEPLLGPVDTYLAALLGILRTAFMLSVVLWIVDSLRFDIPAGWSDESALLPLVVPIAPSTLQAIARFIPFFAGII